MEKKKLTMNEKLAGRFKTKKAVLYQHIGYLNEVDNVLTLENTFNEKAVLNFQSRGQQDAALQEGLDWSLKQVGSDVTVLYSNSLNKTLNGKNAQRINVSLNESHDTYQTGLKRLKTILG